MADEGVLACEGDEDQAFTFQPSYEEEYDPSTDAPEIWQQVCNVEEMGASARDEAKENYEDNKNRVVDDDEKKSTTKTHRIAKRKTKKKIVAKDPPTTIPEDQIKKEGSGDESKAANDKTTASSTSESKGSKGRKSKNRRKRNSRDRRSIEEAKDLERSNRKTPSGGGSAKGRKSKKGSDQAGKIEEGTYEIAYALKGIGDRIYRAYFHPTQEHVIAMVEDNMVCIIDLDERQVLKKYVHPPEYGAEEFSTLAWTQFNTYQSEVVLAVAGSQMDIKLIDVEGGELYGVLEGHDYPVAALCFSPINPRWLISGGEGPDIFLWEITAPSEKFQPRRLARFAGHAKMTFDLAFSPNDGFAFLAAGKRNRASNKKDANRAMKGLVTKWTISLQIEEQYKKKRNTVTVPVSAGQYYPCPKVVETVAWLPNDIGAYKERYQHDIHVFDLDSKEETSLVAALKHDGNPVGIGLGVWFMRMTLNEDASRLLMATDHGEVRIYDVSIVNKKKKRKLPIPPVMVLQDESLVGKDNNEKKSFYSVALSKDKKYIVCGSNANDLVVWQRKESS